MLNEIKAPEVFQMVRILRILQLNNLSGLADPKTRRALGFKTPKMMKDGQQVDLPRDKWTEAQVKAETDYHLALGSLLMKVMDLMMSRFGDPEFEKAVYTLLAMGTRTDPARIQNLSGVEFVMLLDEYISREEFADFFRQAWKLFSRSVSTNLKTSFTDGIALQNVL